MNIHRLEWDSDFFGLRIGRADIETTEDSMYLTSMTGSLRKEFDLLYVFDPKHIGFKADGAKMVDEKVLYIKPIERRYGFDDVIMYSCERPSSALYHLAHISGEYSRFKLDDRFPEGSFEKMYDRWIENSCPKEGTNRQIFIHCLNGNPKGMITVDYDSCGVAHIGLVSVDTDCQHSGIGTKILCTAEEYLFRQGNIHTVEVPTQKSNKVACLWYEKNGFSVASVVDIYHWWFYNIENDV